MQLITVSAYTDPFYKHGSTRENTNADVKAAVSTKKIYVLMPKKKPPAA
jgi:hypothetical protein